MKIVLAYSGGLDTSIIIPWLREKYPNSEVICVYVNVGQEEDTERLQKRAKDSGATRLYVVDARNALTEQYIFPLLRSGALYERQYYLGTAIARPLQASQQVRIAQIEQADALAHGCTGKGNDQLRFELTYQTLAPELQIIAPWRVWDIRSREDAIKYARAHGVPLDGISEKNIYSRDENIWHMSHEGGSLEDITQRADSNILLRTRSPEEAPDKESLVTITFEHGIPVSVNGTHHGLPVQLLDTINSLASENGIGIVDIVETRIVGMKSRALYETPGGTVLYYALRELEAITMEKGLRFLKGQLADHYADLVYGGRWFSAERQAIDGFMECAARSVTGEITLSLYKGLIRPVKRHAEHSLYDQDVASFGEGGYEHAHATGFVKLYGLSSMLAAKTQERAHSYDACLVESYTL